MNSTVLALQITLDLQQFNSPRQVRITKNGRLYYRKVHRSTGNYVDGILGIYDSHTPINNIKEDIEVTL